MATVNLKSESDIFTFVIFVVFIIYLFIFCILYWFANKVIEIWNPEAELYEVYFGRTTNCMIKNRADLIILIFTTLKSMDEFAKHRIVS